MIYKSEFIDLREVAGLRKGAGGDSCGLIFARDPTNPQLVNFLDDDGLPYPGTSLQVGREVGGVRGLRCACCFFIQQKKFSTGFEVFNRKIGLL